MFIIVRFGADEEELFNPDCASRVLVENIKKRCDCVERESVALIDDKYNLVPINEKSMENAASVFQDRMVYTLLGIEKKQGSVNYVPLIDDAGKEMIAKLEQLSHGKNVKKSNRRHTQYTMGKSTQQPVRSQQSTRQATTPIGKSRKKN